MQDELLPASACGACGHVFLPSTDPWIACTACGACHARPELTSGELEGKGLVERWLALFMGRRLEHIPAGGVLHRDESGRTYLPNTAEIVRSDGYLALIEVGSLAYGRSVAYIALRVAASFERATPIASVAEELAPAGRVIAHRWGLELVAEGAGVQHVRRLGRERAVRALVATARAHGGQPFYALGRATSMPAELEHELASRERTIRCDACGAPVALPILAGQSSASCPYCTAPITLPEQMRQELVSYRSRLRIHDAMGGIDLRAAWARWESCDASKDLLACAVCGAPSEHTPGIVDARCAHCSAMIIPSSERLEADIDAMRSAREATGRAADERRRRATVASQTLSRSSALLNVGLVVGSVSLLPMAILTILALKWLASDHSLRGLGVIALVAVPIVAIGGIVAFLLLRSSARRARWGRIWSALATQVDGSPTHWERWIGRWWVGAVERGNIMYGPSKASGAIELELDGLPVLIEGDLEADVGVYRSMYARSHLRVLVAARWPSGAGALLETEGVLGRRRALLEGGFATCVRRAGIEVVATPEVCARIKRSHGSMAMIVPIAYEARRIARMLGATPPAQDDGRSVIR